MPAGCICASKDKALFAIRFTLYAKNIGRNDEAVSKEIASFLAYEVAGERIA